MEKYLFNLNSMMMFHRRFFWGLGLVATLVFSQSAFAGGMAFPDVDEIYGESRILRSYQPYLRYVLTIARQTEPSQANLLAERYDKLRKHSPEGAARFLKGLRFEMIHKLQLMGLSERQATTSHPEMRRWVGRFVKTWAREADELLYRSIALAKR